ncbi:1552_t:CDS:1 [Acaulospora colombiana]|uniref:1552_t:CDS:1 n=1 Tax=Acaulospora colombiana TaxID=27376 RepID=A0ACA9L9X6_9GLOM|nr:1552_t:CDS:1 [Acaulospora colombiana]
MTSILTSQKKDITYPQAVGSKLYKKLLRDGYKHFEDLSDYLEDAPPIDIGDYGTIYPLAGFFHPALIPPISTLMKSRDICKRCPISIANVVGGGINILDIEKNGQTALHNLIQMGYPDYSLSKLLY